MGTASSHPLLHLPAGVTPEGTAWRGWSSGVSPKSTVLGWRGGAQLPRAAPRDDAAAVALAESRGPDTPVAPVLLLVRGGASHCGGSMTSRLLDQPPDLGAHPQKRVRSQNLRESASLLFGDYLVFMNRL